MKAILAIAFVALASTAHADAKFPPYLTLPAVKVGEVQAETFGHFGFALPDGTKTEVAGKKWFAYLDATGIADDKRFATFVDALGKSGWKIVLDEGKTSPPRATLKLVKGTTEAWLELWAGGEAAITLIEKGPPPTRLTLPRPIAGIDKVGDAADFPFLLHFPGAKLTESKADARPFFVSEDGKEPTLVAGGSVLKSYAPPAGTSGYEVVVVYREALVAAGWKIVASDLDVGDAWLTAHYAKDAIDLWVYVHSVGDIAVADAGAERETKKLREQLDRTCRVAIYGVNFDFDKATLRADATPALESIQRLLAEVKDLKVELGGHTDNIGARDYNQKLSENRVAAVKAWLVGKGIADGRLTAKGYADTVPVAPNDAPEGRARNRRVELRKLDCKR